jgi:hypothetical protein
MRNTFEFSGDYEWARWRTGGLCSICHINGIITKETVGVRIDVSGPNEPVLPNTIEVTPVCGKCADEAGDEEGIVVRFIKENKTKIIYHLGTDTYFSLDDDVVIIDTAEVNEYVDAELMDDEGHELAVYWGKRITDITTEDN